MHTGVCVKVIPKMFYTDFWPKNHNYEQPSLTKLISALFVYGPLLCRRHENHCEIMETTYLTSW